ncbi:response regulator transcription factor [Salinicola endophyticus]|uniref:Response regulator transcription factor n=1 Tax=Salinicola endophyticus TaxID=1949083 RepID=A0ABY8FCY0_9GAMM|nr:MULTISPECIES: response regulator transcription factor [Salinicola]WFF40640.1 response regulator transcription factor [Salinicola endophyticus]
MHLLVIEDDPLLSRSLGEAMSRAGYGIDALTRVEDAWQALRQRRFDLILLDLGLPDGSGLELLARLRDTGDATPVMILTARDGLEDRVRGLDLGADDYLAKPFSISELEARVRALLRRSQQRIDDRLHFACLTLDTHAASVWLAGEPLDLPRREFRLLEALMLNAGRIVARESLEDRLFGFEAVGANALEVYVSRLRKRLQETPLAIRTLRGLGYRLEERRE